MKYLFRFCGQEFSSWKVWGSGCFLKPHFVGWSTDFVLSVISEPKTSFPLNCSAVTRLLSVNYHWSGWSIAGASPASVQVGLQERPKSFWLLIDVVASVDFFSVNFHTVICLLRTSPIILYPWVLSLVFGLFLALAFNLYVFLQPPHPSFGCFSISLSSFLWPGRVDPFN